MSVPDYLTPLGRKTYQPFLAEGKNQWDTTLLQSQHLELLWNYGELCVYTLMWHTADFDAGLVGICMTCSSGGPQHADDRRVRAFEQPTRRRCPDCYGTTLEGGFRAQVIRPTLMADRNSVVSQGIHGEVVSDTINLETTDDITIHLGDYVFRSDGSRYQVEEKNEAVLRTGFTAPESADSYSGATTAHLEMPGTPAYDIPPSTTQLVSLLEKIGPFLTNFDLSSIDVIRPNGYL